MDNSGQGPLQSISLDQFSTSTGKVLMQGTTPVSQGENINLSSMTDRLAYQVISLLDAL